jgi:hypothetical protein
MGGGEKMEEKIAVQCHSEEEFMAAQAKRGGRSHNTWEACKCTFPGVSIGISLEDYTWCSINYYRANGYTIISASEYLGDGITIKTTKKEERKMLKCISGNYEKTNDAVLVEEEFGEEITNACGGDNFTAYLHVGDNAGAYFKEATARRKERETKV